MQKLSSSELLHIFTYVLFALVMTVVFISPGQHHADLSGAKPNEVADLRAQQSMAQAAWFMFGLGAIQLAVGLFGIWFVRETLIETRRSNIISEERSESETRPWLSINHVSVKCNRHTHLGRSYFRFRVNYEISNFGTSPAVTVSSGVQGSWTEPGEDIRTLIEEWTRIQVAAQSDGPAIFPGQSDCREQAFLLTDVGSEFTPTFAIVVTYRSPKSTKMRVTRVVYDCVLQTGTCNFTCHSSLLT